MTYLHCLQFGFHFFGFIDWTFLIFVNLKFFRFRIFLCFFTDGLFLVIFVLFSDLFFLFFWVKIVFQFFQDVYHDFCLVLGLISWWINHIHIFTLSLWFGDSFFECSNIKLETFKSFVQLLILFLLATDKCLIFKDFFLENGLRFVFVVLQAFIPLFD